jgi:glycosyltransferase involved in cell wall biosynthesis
MAAGLCIILYSKAPQPSMTEVIGNAGIICKTQQGFENKIIEMLENPDKKKEWGLKAKTRAKEYTIEKMIAKYNKLFKEIQ